MAVAARQYLEAPHIVKKVMILLICSVSQGKDMAW